MSGMFSSPKMPDTSAQQKQIADQEAKTAATEAATREKASAKLRSRLGRVGGAGGNSLLTGLETGLRDTLG